MTISENNALYWTQVIPGIRKGMAPYFKFPTKEELLEKIAKAEKIIADTKEMLKYYE